MKSAGRAVSVVALVSLVFSASFAEPNGLMVSGRLEIQGNRLTVFSDGVTNDAEQTINAGEHARIRTCYGGLTNECGNASPGDPRIAGLSVLAEVRGPELPQAIPLRTIPGGAFEIPGFQQEGDYFVENIRLVNDATGAVLGPADPPVAVLHVRQIALASATVTTLSLEDLAARGISITQENFQAFNFAVGFYFGEEFVSIDLPVIYQGNGQVNPLTRPTVNLDGLPPEIQYLVSRWQPPSIIPFTLEIPELDPIDAGEEPFEPITFPVFGAIVMPGSVSFLNQFFDAKLIIANGAPMGSQVDLDNLLATLRLPSGNVLRVADTEPPVGSGQPVPVLTEVGDHIVPPEEQGAATWTIEGLVAGTHVLQMDVEGELVRPGRETVPVATRAQAAVEVVDARFHLIFSHPDVVREGSAYSLFVTVVNLSQATQNLISVEIRDEYITGAHKDDPGDDFIRTIETLAPGQSETIEYRLVSDVTGQVLGGTLETLSSQGSGNIQLYTGVGEFGIPLSPATLRLPRFSERLSTPYTVNDDYYVAAMRFLGLAYSLAVAPAGMAPQGLPHVIRADVEARAVDMGFAGQRTFLDEPLLESLEVLLLDWLGNREALIEIDELRRLTDKGVLVSDQLAALLRYEQEQRALRAVELFDHFAETTSYARKYLSVMLVPGFAAEPPDLEILRFIDGVWTQLAGYADSPDYLRSVPYGDFIPVGENAGGSQVVPLALIGHVETDDLFEVFLRNDTDSEKAGRLLLIVPDGDSGDYRRLDFGTVNVPPHTIYAVTVGAGVADPVSGGFVMVNTTTLQPVAGVTASKTQVPLPPFRIIGVRQDFGIGKGAFVNLYGHAVSYLFNRPPDQVSGESAESYRIESSFSGFDVRGDPFAATSELVGTQAFLQPSERVVNVRYDRPLSALVNPATSDPLVIHQHLLDPLAIIDHWGDSLDPSIPEPQIDTDPVREGGLLSGKVLRGTGVPAEGALVQLVRPRDLDTPLGFDTKLDLVAEAITGPDGAFFFDFIETPHKNPNVGDRFTLRAIVPEGADAATEPAGIEELSSTIRQQNRVAYVNIAMLGRGTVTGRLIYLDTGDPVPEGRVTISSTLFQDSKTAVVEADGSFEVLAMPVGPLTLTGRDLEGRTVYATVGLEQPGSVVDVLLELPRTQPPGLGTVVGTVYRLATGDPLPGMAIAGAEVEVYSAGASLGRVDTDGFGHFRFSNIPEGQITVQAADWRVSRTAVAADLLLAADEVAEVRLTLPESEPRTITGRVLFYDPVTNSYLPVVNQPAFIAGPGVFAYTDVDGSYRIEGVPVQAAGASPYQVTAIDYERKLQGDALLPPILDTSPDEVAAQDIVLREMRGGIRGVVLDPLGRPLFGVKIVAAWKGVPYIERNCAGDGSFFLDNLPPGEWELTAHSDDGLQTDRVGYFGSAETGIIFGGHTPFVSIRLAGSGVVNVQVKTEVGSGIQSEIYYRPTYFSDASKTIVIKGSAIQAQTDPTGFLELELPVGNFEITAFSPFHGVRSTTGTVEWAGQVKTANLVFGSASTVTGTLVGVDGTTPIPDFQVVFETSTLLPQTQHTDAQGRFQFELVPEGAVRVTAEGIVGAVERVGVANGRISGGGQILDLTVRMKPQGTVEGHVFERIGADLLPLPFAQYYVRESNYPNRRLPSSSGWYATDGDGRYQVSHVFAGGVTVVARDPNQTSRQGSVRGAIATDWQVVQLPDIVMSTSVGSIEITIRDPETGGMLPDTQVTLRQGSYFNEMTVADSAGLAVYDALPLGAYSVYAFHAPTGRSGVRYGLTLGEPGQLLETTLYVDQRGEVAGTLYDDWAKLFPVPGGAVRLSGSTAGGGLTALDTTSGRPETLGDFSFLGIPEGDFSLSAWIAGSNRRAGGEVSITATAPLGLTDLILEPAGEVVFRIFENLNSGLAEVDSSSVLLSVRLQQSGSYDFTLLQPTQPFPGHHYSYSEVLLERAGSLTVQELGGEQRDASMSAADFISGVPLAGGGTAVDPYLIVLRPKGVVRVTVLDALAIPMPDANVTLISSGGGVFPSVTDGGGQVTFSAVPAGDLTASASAPLTGFGGRSIATLVYDDDIIEMVVNLAPAVAAHGVVYQPLPGDLYSGDPTTLAPQAGAIVVIHDSLGDQQVITTGADGSYRFNVLPTGSYTIDVQTPNGENIGGVSGTLVGPDGYDNEIPAIILDGGPPQILSITPLPGMHDVSRTAVVEIVFSEPLLPAVLPTGQPTSPYFELRGPSGLATGSWSWGYDTQGRPVVSFTPSTPYDNTAVYSIAITGGPSGVRDLSNRPLTQSGNVGANFTTSDSIGPKVIATEPSLSRPVDPEADLRFDFNEAVAATDEQLDGDGVDDAAVFSWGQDDGAGGVTWQPFPISLFLTRSDYSLSVDPVDGLVLTDDTLARRIEIDGLEDSQGNAMAEPYLAEFRIRDENPPAIDDLPFPPLAPTGELVPGAEYLLTPVLSGIDHLPYDPPEGDIDRVDYFFADPTAPDGPTQPDVSVSTPPFSFGFIAAYSGNGIDPRLFPVWARAVDTSTNESNVALIELQILPNQAPTVSAVDATPLSPVAGVPYAGSILQATVSGLGDPDGSELALRVELWQVAGALLDGPVSLNVQRPPTGWGDLTPPTATLTVPIDEPENAELVVRVVATDAQGASVSFDSTTFTVADDQGQPIIEAIVVRDAVDASPRSLFHIGDELYIEFTVRDIETAVLGADVGFDRSDIFPSPQTATRVSGNLYRTPTLSVPVDLFTETTPVELTVTADDRGGNSATTTFGFEVAPAPDPTAPTVEWLTPWEGGAWPAVYTSVVSPGTGVAMLLRVHARDLSDDGAGGTIPGAIVDVLFRGPVDDGAGGIELASSPIPGTLLPDTAAPGEGVYEVTWPVPDQIADGAEVPFEVRVVDSGGLDVVVTIRMQAQPYRKVYEGVQTAALAGDPMLAPGGAEEGPVFLLDGALLSLYPQDDGSVRLLDSLHLYSGGHDDAGTLIVHGTRLTAPEVTSYGSPVLYYPLELEVGDILAVGAGARIDMSRRGLLGCTDSDAMVLAGETRAGGRAGGSHGGLGWFGAPTWWSSTTTRYQPSSSYGVVRFPYLPGAGGGGWGTTPGGNGGGVIRLLAGDATVRIVGDILADGGSSVVGGGAGGAIELTVGRLEGRGLISARGGDSTDADRSGGGGGGRIAVSFCELGGGADPAAQADTRGGGNGGAFLGGAGTVYIDARDPATGESSGVGSLRVVNNDGLPAASTLLPSLGDGVVVDVDPAGRLVTVATSAARGAITGESLVLEDDGGVNVGLFPIVSQLPIAGGFEFAINATETELFDLLALIGAGTVSAHGRARYAEVVADGMVRQAFDDDVAIGSVGDPNPALNDPASLTLLGGNARAVVRGDKPIFAVTVTPAPGTDVGVGSSISLSWTVTDPVGLATTDESWPLDGYAHTRPTDSQPLTRTIDPDPLQLTVPADAPAGLAVYTVTATDVAGRATEQQLSWNVLPNSSPTAALAFGDGAPTTVQAGFATTVEVHAEDAEGVASITLNAIGPAVVATQTTVVNGAIIDLPFTVDVFSDADGAVPIVLQATVTDTSGVAVASNTLQVTVTPDLTLPTATIELAPVVVDDTYIAGDPVTITVNAADDVSVSSLAVTFDGETTTTAGEPIVLNWVAPPVSESTDFPVDVEVLDPSGNLGIATRTLIVEPLDNPDAPVVSIGCPLNGDLVAPGVPIGIDVEVTDDDQIENVSLLVDGVPYGAPVTVNATTFSGTLEWTPPVDALAGETFMITVEARDYAANVGQRSVVLSVVSGTILSGDQLLTSDHSGEDLVLASGTFTATLNIRPDSLTLLTGAKLTTQNLQQLVIETPGAIQLACSSSIDANGRGYAGNATYPGTTEPGHSSGAGSHLGEGGIHTSYLPPGSTFGSVSRPQENGSGGSSTTYGKRGGGAIYIEADSIDLQGTAAIRANGTSADGNYNPGGGGSIWITSSSITGTGEIRADGGTYTGIHDHGDGGGGAIAVEYTSIDQAILDGLSSTSHSSHLWWGPGGAGTVFLKGPGSTHGDLFVRNADIYSPRLTVLPSLGGGAAQAGSSGVVLETDLAESVPAYFMGHWVEIRDPGDTLKGAWRIETINGTTITLEAGADVAENDRWQGVYRFDSVTISDYGQVKSEDPIRTTDVTLTDGGRLDVSEPIDVATLTLGGGANSSIMWTPITASSSVEIVGPGKAYAQSITAPSLTVRSGATLSQAATGGSTTVPANLVVQVSDLVIEDGGAIDATGRGYAGDTTYPGATEPGHSSGAGSHLGEGGVHTSYLPPGSTFGSVTRPQENGGGGNDTNYGKRGGGAIYIEADSIDLQGTATIKASGASTNGNDRPGAGGSVWITASSITGTGEIRADGGSYGGTSQYGDGGGGAIAVEYTSIDQAIIDGLSATSHSSHLWWGSGGAGTLFLKGPGSTYGDLIVVNAALSTPRWTVLPSLSSGTAQTGSLGITLETGIAEAIPAYFEGHWVEIRHPDGTLKGTWLVETINGTTITLESTADVAEGDSWYGIYRFDTLLVADNAKLRIDDLDEIGSVTVDPGSMLVRANLGGPAVEPALVLLEGRDGGWAVSGLPGAITDPDGVVSATAVNETAGGSWPLAVAGDGSFPAVTVTGVVGDLIRIDATDGHSINPRSSLIEIGTLPANSAPPVIDAGLVGFSYDGGSTHLTGATGAVADANSPILVTVENTTAGGSWSTTAATDGSFDLVVSASCGDQLTLTATDAHPAPLQTSADLGAMPDLVPPVLNSNNVYIRSHDRAFWAVGASGAVNEECSIDSAYLSDPALPSVQSPVTVEANGSFADTLVPSTTAGVVPQLTAIDGGGNSATIDLDPLPGNDGPPQILISRLSTSTSVGQYEISSTTFCIELKQSPGCDYPFEDADSIDTVRLENRTTPGFGPREATVVSEHCIYCSGGRGHSIDPTVITGAVGDEIWVVVEDGHPQWQTSEALVWTLPGISGAPAINLGSIDLVYHGGQFRLSAGAGAVTDADAPISLEAVLWRDVAGEWVEIARETDSIASGVAFEVIFPAGAEGDLVVLSATDSTGRSTARRVGTLPPAVAITVALGNANVSIGESAGSVSIPVSLSAAPPVSVSVEYRTIPGTATADVDYGAVSGTIVFGPTVTSDEIVVSITSDSEIEPDETFQVVLENPVGIELGTTTTSEITIFDDDGETRTVTYSVGVDDGNMLTQPITFSVVGGVATFAQPLPVGPDRGDEILLDDGTKFFIVTWIDDSTYELVSADGLPAPNIVSASAVSITPAFSSLEAAVDGASDADHLGSADLVSLNRSLEILCYSGSGDSTPVTIDGWITSPDHRIRIVAPTASGIRNGSQRHSGRYHGQAYRLTPWNTDALTSTVGNLSIEGLQIIDSGNASTPIHVIRLDGIDGDVEILETIIQLDNQDNTADRVGVSVSASEPMNLLVRNTLIWDLGDGSATGQVGILTDDSQVTATIVSSTIIGGASGIRSGAGTVTAINNLVAGAATACFDGSFTAESIANLATDATAPNAVVAGVSPMTVQGSISGSGADLHIGCLVSDQAVTITSSAGISFVDYAFDGKPDTVFISDGVNPATIRLVFDQPRTLSGTAVEFSNSSTHDWMVAAADTVADLDAQTGSYRVLVPWRALDNMERAYEHAAFDQPETATVLELNVQRMGGGDHVHINEWWLDGLNPACGQGVPLDGGADGFEIDVDSLIRIGPWDIGADQHDDLSLFYWWGQRDWWESEGEARVQILLSNPVDTAVSVRYRTENGVGIAGEDYVHVEGELLFAPGEVSKIVTIPIIDDGPGDDNEEIFLRLENADGAGIVNNRWSFWTRDDGLPPDRIRLLTPFVVVNEADGVAVIEAEVDTTPATDLVFAISTIDGSAHIVTDFTHPWVDLVIPAGQLTGSQSLTIVNDDIAEPDEVFYLKGNWTSYAHGAPVYGIVRIIDDDLPSLAFSDATIDVEETVGSVDLTIEIIGEIVDPVTVDVVLGVGTATVDEDFEFNPLQLQFDASHRARTVTVSILENAEYEEDETIVLNLTNASGATVGTPSSATITILAQDPPLVPTASFASDSYSIVESDDSFNVVVGVDPPLDVGTATIDVVIIGGTATQDYDYDFYDTTLTFISSQTEQLLNALGYADDEIEDDETIILQLTNAVGMAIGSPSIATLTIIDDDGAGIDPNLLSVDLSGCTPALVGAPGAVTAAEAGIAVNVLVRDRNSGSPWNAPVLEIEGGEAFRIELPSLDLGGLIQVSAQAVAGGDIVYETINLADFPPVIDEGRLDITPSPTDVTVTIEGAGAVTDRLSEIRLTLVNTTAGTQAPLDDPCAAPLSSASISALPSDEVELQACHGVELELCTSVFVQEGGGP